MMWFVVVFLALFILIFLGLLYGVMAINSTNEQSRHSQDEFQEHYLAGIRKKMRM